MSDKKYTPGPWKIKKYPTLFTVDIISDSSNWQIAEKILMKDANLIAAAPELLGELEKQCLRCFTDQLCSIPEDCKVCTTHAAIAKAHGETP